MANKLCFYLILLHISLSFVLIQSAPKGSLVTKLPGFNGTLPSNHYAGYVTVDESHGRNLFYYFVESEGNPSKDPVVLWLNGGPACSSFDAFVYEHGPFNFEKPETKGALPTLHLNPYSWSKVSNIIYLDSPAGTGFSYSKNKSDYHTGDLKTAFDTHAFLLKWFELYPEFLSNPFFLSGESYAGAYVPTLADEVVKGIDAGTKPKLNFKGYLIGNGVTDDEFDGNAFVPFTHGMGLISDQLFEEITRECHGNFYDPATDKCEQLLSKMDKVLKGLNVYDILEPCYHRPLQQGMRKRMFGRAQPLNAILKKEIVPTLSALYSDVPPCTDAEVSTLWLNNPEVRRAIHTIEESVVTNWTICTSRVNYTIDTGSMIPYHKNLTSKGYRALIYSGDHDMRVPYTGSQAWTSSIGYKIVDEWRSWSVDDQVAGYTQGYDHNLTFLTIKGAGHTVPQYKPKESLHFYKQFINGLPI